MNRALVMRSVRDNWLLLACCCAVTMLFVILRVWVASKIKVEHFIKIFSEGLKIFQNLLPVPIEELASPLGRSAFSYEEMPVILMLGLWTVARGSECIAGRVGSGTMEMLLAQPLRRIALITSHSVVTLAGIGILGVASLAGLAAGLRVSEFDAPPQLAQLVPSAVNYLGLGVFLLGAATLVSALARTRSQAVGIVIAFYVIQLAMMIIARLSPSVAWMETFTIMAAYEPTDLALTLANRPEEFWARFWTCNAWLMGMGATAWGAAAAIFCRRDVPAPL